MRRARGSGQAILTPGALWVQAACPIPGPIRDGVSPLPHRERGAGLTPAFSCRGLSHAVIAIRASAIPDAGTQPNDLVAPVSFNT